MKFFNSFVQSAVDARRQADENAKTNVVAETMKLIAKSSHCDQIKDWGQHTLTKYLSDKRTHAANNNKLVKKLDNVHNPLYEVELAKTQIEHKKPIVVRLNNF